MPTSPSSGHAEAMLIREPELYIQQIIIAGEAIAGEASLRRKNGLEGVSCMEG